MAERTERDDFDRLLDAALDSYADPGPDSGLERRVLRRIDAARKGTRLRRTLLWSGGLAAAVAVLLFLLVLPTRWQRTPPHAAPGIASSAAPALPARAAAAVETPRPAQRLVPHAMRAASHAAAQAAALPKLNVFPTPAPLSREERALVRLATETSAKQRNELLAAQKESSEPLRIAAISIPPLEQPPAEGKE